jgi:glycosyltransferase involved in cell wall biosynthesis
MKKLKIALVYDRVNKFGGAERVLLSMHEIWPDAPIFTAVYDAEHAGWSRVFQVIPSFLGKFPFARQHHELYAWATPMAFESFSFDKFDIVISVTSAEAKNIITKPSCMHICYCLTPTRYLWSGFDQYEANPGIGVPDWIALYGFRRIAPTLRRWDMVASSRPDRYIAISQLVSRRIVSYYRRNVDRVIYPPVDVDMFAGSKKGRRGMRDNGYFLVVARLVGYKRVDLIIDAFNRLGWPLVIVGDGHQKRKLRSQAKGNIRFIDSLTDQQLVHYYRNCRAFVFAGEEDFGIAAVEAQAAGVPVVAYKQSGIAEIVIPGTTGELFEEQTVDSLIGSLEKCMHQWYDSSLCALNAQRFSKDRFKREMKDTVQELYNTYI